MRSAAARFLTRLSGAATAAAVGALAVAGGPGARSPGRAPQPAERFAGALVAAGGVSEESLAQLRARGYRSVALALSGGDPLLVRQAARRVRQAGLGLHYWVEVGRCPPLAALHPEWMASLQGHQEWRRLFPEAPVPRSGEVVKCYPWVPVLFREAFAAHRQRLEEMLAPLPRADGIFLNDLQGGPSACGCGNLLCRWTTDYGPVKTAARLGDDAAARFVEAAAKAAGGIPVIPVWTTECEEADGGKDGPCAGVGCFHGACWRESTRQLVPLAAVAPTLGVLVPYRAFGRDLPRYGVEAGWVKAALESLRSMPPRHGGRPVPAARLIAVVQGWDVSPEAVAAQVARSREAGAAGHLVALLEIEQSWEPRRFALNGR